MLEGLPSPVLPQVEGELWIPEVNHHKAGVENGLSLQRSSGGDRTWREQLHPWRCWKMRRRSHKDRVKQPSTEVDHRSIKPSCILSHCTAQKHGVSWYMHWQRMLQGTALPEEALAVPLWMGKKRSGALQTMPVSFIVSKAMKMYRCCDPYSCEPRGMYPCCSLEAKVENTLYVDGASSILMDTFKEQYGTSADGYFNGHDSKRGYEDPSVGNVDIRY